MRIIDADTLLERIAGINEPDMLTIGKVAGIIGTHPTVRERDYQQGRADKYQEIVSEYMLLTEEQVNQIRAEVIDEFYNRLLDDKNKINTAYYPWKYIELVARKMTERIKEIF